MAPHPSHARLTARQVEHSRLVPVNVRLHVGVSHARLTARQVEHSRLVPVNVRLHVGVSHAR
jgi:hypothetical protein